MTHEEAVDFADGIMRQMLKEGRAHWADDAEKTLQMPFLEFIGAVGTAAYAAAEVEQRARLDG